MREFPLMEFTMPTIISVLSVEMAPTASEITKHAQACCGKNIRTVALPDSSVSVVWEGEANISDAELIELVEEAV